MCGIYALFCPKCNGDIEKYLHALKPQTIKSSDTLRHRGPDWSGVFQDHQDDFVVSMAHERLSIIDPEHGAQPIVNHEQTLALSVNGEIYNYISIKDKFKDSYQFVTGSDCEVVLPLYQSYLNAKATGSTGGVSSLVELVNSLDGVFAFVLYDKVNKTFLVARDPIGVNPLYYGFTDTGEICFASELKALHDVCSLIKEFPPGYFATYTDGKLEINQYYTPLWAVSGFNTKTPEEVLPELKQSLIDAVDKRLMADVPIGTLLSGGLDSSLIASIAMKIVKEKGTKFGHQLHSFSIGMEGSPDLVAAQKVADFIGTEHHGFHFTFDDGLNAVPKVIQHLETYDVTTVRASTPMFLLARMIKAMGIKMVLSGEGADEILGGYLYFHKAPTPEAFHCECCDRVYGLHTADCLRANKSTMAFGLEGRFPFLDKNFMETAIPIHPELKCAAPEGKPKIEKYALRKAFDDGTYLPDEILWRQKEQFSDGVGYSWIDGLKDYAEKTVSDESMAMASHLYPYNTPATKEAFYYRRIFEELYPKAGCAQTVAKWVPKTEWEGVDSDPSGRSQGIHDAHSEWVQEKQEKTK